MLLARIICLIMGYACGMWLFGYFYSRSKGQDITKVGSGNAGATNIMRAYGWKAALATFLWDGLKICLAIFLAWLIYHGSYPDEIRLLEMYAALGGVIGHNHPFYMKNFKGGKGVSSTAGLLLGYCPIQIPLILVLFVVTVALTGYVSVGSMMILAAFFVQMVVFGQLGLIAIPASCAVEIYVLTAIISVMGILRHRENIVRLIHGNENRFHFNKG